MKPAGPLWRLGLAAVAFVALSVIGLAAGAASTLQAPATSPIVCAKVAAPVNVDGALNEWASIPGVSLDAASAQYVSGLPGGPADISALLRCAWDAQWLYLAVDVADDFLIADSSTIWDDDGVEIALDGEHDRACCSGYDHQFTYAIDSRLADFGTVQAPSPLRWTIMPRQGGYLVETAIPMAMVLSGTPVSGTLLGFNWGLNDDDDGGRRDKHLLWADSSILTFPEFGDLQLGGLAGVLPTATPTATSVPGSTPTQTPRPTATRTTTPTPAASGTPVSQERVAALETNVKNLGTLLDEIWSVMQTLSYLPGDIPPLPTPTPTRASGAPAYVQRVRCGGQAYTDTAGQTWAADQPYTPGSWGYVGGSSYETTVPIAGTADQALYRAERYNMAAYQFDVPNAVYRVELRFAEIYQYADAGQRIFDVSLEGIQAIAALDLFAVAGAYTAYDRTFDTIVLDGQLNIDFAASKGAPKVSAIKVTALSAAGPTPTPSLEQRVAAVESQMTALEQLLQRILALFDQFVGM